MKRSKTTRIRNGVRQALFGGYAVWWSKNKDIDKQKLHEKEVRIWADASIQDDDCGHGTDTIVALLKQKIDPTGKRQAEVRECWRY